MASGLSRIVVAVAASSLAWSIIMIAVMGPGYARARRGCTAGSDTYEKSCADERAIGHQLEQRSLVAALGAVVAGVAAAVLVIRKATRSASAYVAGVLAVVGFVLAFLVGTGELWN
jgi:hypothetical protein